jgi:surface antigen
MSLALAASANAAILTVRLRVSGNVEIAGLNQLTAIVETGPRASCALRVTVGGVVRTFRSELLGKEVWRWTAASSRSKGMWTFLATCREGHRWAWRRYRTELGFPERAGALMEGKGATDSAPPPGESTGIGATCDEQDVCFANNPNPVGQCTWYAEGRRPDLLGIVHGNAAEWLSAAKGRVPEGSQPVVGAIAVWGPDVGPAGVVGHVGYVAAISGSRVLIDDSNWRPTPWSPGLQVHEHWEPANSPSGYIYGGT